MVKSRLDAANLVLVILGFACLGGGIAGLFRPEWAWQIVATTAALPMVFGGAFHLGLRVGEAQQDIRAKAAQAEQIETVNYARYLSNQERERKLEAGVSPLRPAADYSADWQAARHRFVQHGVAHDFSIQTLAANGSPHKCIEWDNWGVLAYDLADLGVLVIGQGKRKTQFAHGWTWARWERERSALPVPHKLKAPPVVTIPTATLTQRNANATETPADTAEVVDIPPWPAPQ